MHQPHCLIDDLSGRGFLCLSYEDRAALWELLEVSGVVTIRTTQDLDSLVRHRLRDLGPLSLDATMLDCVRVIRAAKES